MYRVRAECRAGLSLQGTGEICGTLIIMVKFLEICWLFDYKDDLFLEAFQNSVLIEAGVALIFESY